MEWERHPKGDGEQPANDNGADTGKQIDLHTSDNPWLNRCRFSEASWKPLVPANDNAPIRQ